MNHNDLLVRPGAAVRLGDLDPGFTCDFKKKSDARDKLESDVERLSKLQELLYAAQSHALLIVLQGMDCSGKDGAIKHVMSGINPQGVHVYSFKAPTDEERNHDFLWRCERVLPERGRVGIFNRSYYEEVLIVRVHPPLLERERLPVSPDAPDLWQERFEEINAFEEHLVRNGTQVVKCFLHISKEEQRRRLLARVDDPSKYWKFSAGDVAERVLWEQYSQAYEGMLNGTSTEVAPWYVIPSDHKWFMRTAIADILIAKLASLDLKYPALTENQRTGLESARMTLACQAAAVARGG